MPQSQRWIWGFISGANSFKIIFLGNKSVCVILLKVSKADSVQISVFALFYPEIFFCDLHHNHSFLKYFHFISDLEASAVWVLATKWCNFHGSFPFHFWHIFRMDNIIIYVNTNVKVIFNTVSVLFWLTSFLPYHVAKDSAQFR